MLEKDAFSTEQWDEIVEGQRENVDVSIYAHPEYLAIQMRQIRLGLSQGLLVAYYAKPDFDWFQMEEIRLGLAHGVNVSSYAKPEISYAVMRQLRLGLEQGIDLASFEGFAPGILREVRLALVDHVDLRTYIRLGYVEEQLAQIRLAKKAELSIDRYLHLSLRGASICEIRLGLEQGLDVSLYASEEMSWQQMREVRLGLAERIDVTIYNNELFAWQQMREIRLGLESGIDVTTYANLMYTPREMALRREILTRYIDEDTSAEIQERFDEFSLFIDAGKMEAFLLFSKKGIRIPKEHTYRALQEQGVVYGIDVKAIERLAEEGADEEIVIVARGEKAENGTDGWYEYFFDTNVCSHPPMREDGSVDFSAIRYFATANAGERVALYHDATEGVVGCNVLGEKLLPKRGRQIPALFRKGVRLEEDGHTYTANISGRIDIQGDTLSISPVAIYEDVTKATGNVDFNGSVYVRGTVGEGVKIRAAADVIVDRFCESAEITAGGNIVLREGHNANGEGCLRAKGDIIGSFFENANLSADGDIQANYCLNSHVSAGGEITITGRYGRLAGGKAHAGRTISVYHLGNEASVRTEVTLGYGEHYYERMKEIQDALASAKRELTLLRSAYEDMQAKLTSEQRNANPMYLKVEDAIYTKKKECKNLQEQRAALEAEAAAGVRKKVIVGGHLYPGVVVSMDGLHFTSADADNVTIRRSEDRIVLVQNR